MNIINLVIAIIIGGLFGNILFAKIFATAFGTDLTKTGSKNIGSTNLSRLYGWKIGLLTAHLDAIKVVLAMVLLKWVFKLNDIYILIGGLSAIVSHCYPIFNNFKGGKGVAASIGFAFIILPIWFFIFLVIFYLLLAAKTKIISYSSLLFVVITFVASFFFLENWFSTWTIHIWPFTMVLMIFIFFKHRQNIINIWNKTEKKLGINKSN